MELPDFLKRALAGGAILFCGAGFSSDCLNLADRAELGTGAALLAFLNQELDANGLQSYRELKNAADQYVTCFGEHRLLALLRDRFKVAHVTDDMIELVRFPWRRIYTTNYDNAIQLACIRAAVDFKTLNNLDEPGAIPGAGIEVVHIHGRAEKWDIHNFRRSCVLGADSYFEANNALGNWARRLQEDFERASVFIFVGFGAGDFHLNRVFFNVREARPKVFFVNRPTVELDPDLQLTQEKFGNPLSIGRSGFANFVRDAMKADLPREPITPSFRQYERPEQAVGVPSVGAVGDLLIFGRIDYPQLVQDVSLRQSKYHVLRTVTDKIIDGIDNKNTVTLITGEICDGKSLVIEELFIRLSGTRRVFIMKHPYDTMIDEVNSIISMYGNPAVVIENCFDISSHKLDGLLHLFGGLQAVLVLTSRSISARAEVSGFELIKDFEFIQHYKISSLDDREIEELTRLSDQIGGWADFPKTPAEKARFIREQCGGSLPGFLLELLQSEFVKNRYAEEYRKTVELLSPSELAPLIATLYISHIGYDTSLSFLSNIFRVDVAATLDDLSAGEQGLHLVRMEGGRVKTVPSIGARRILREIVPTQSATLVVDTVVGMLKRMVDHGLGDDFERRIFSQLMRYSILSTVTTDIIEINRFFDNVSTIDYCRSQVLFWVQWHMAMVDQKRFTHAETYLARGYSEAESYERRTRKHYDRFQIDDRRAKFLMIRDRAQEFRVDTIRDLNEACDITERLLRRNDLTHHPFDTFVEIVDFFDVAGPRFERVLRDAGQARIERLGRLVEQRARELDDGFPTVRAQRAAGRFRALVNR